MSGKNNVYIIYRNFCPHIAITYVAVGPAANGERADVKKYLNRHPQNKA
jgi:hypothetical protein